MIDCWADKLGDCNDKQSREHILSKALFIDDERYKKNLLSPLDDAAVKAFDAFRKIWWIVHKSIELYPRKKSLIALYSTVLCWNDGFSKRQ